MRVAGNSDVNAVHGFLIDGHVYIWRTETHEFVWIGTLAEINAMSPIEAYNRMMYRLDFEVPFCRLVN